MFFTLARPAKDRYPENLPVRSECSTRHKMFYRLCFEKTNKQTKNKQNNKKKQQQQTKIRTRLHPRSHWNFAVITRRISARFVKPGWKFQPGLKFSSCNRKPLCKKICFGSRTEILARLTALSFQKKSSRHSQNVATLCIIAIIAAIVVIILKMRGRCCGF